MRLALKGDRAGQKDSILCGLPYICWEQPQQVARPVLGFLLGHHQEKAPDRSHLLREHMAWGCHPSHKALATPTLLPLHSSHTFLIFF